MKIKQHLFITDPEAFYKGSYWGCFNLYEDDQPLDDWILVGEIEIDINIDKEDARKKAVSAYDEKEKEVMAEFETKLQYIRGKRDELLAITHQKEG